MNVDGKLQSCITPLNASIDHRDANKERKEYRGLGKANVLNKQKRPIEQEALGQENRSLHSRGCKRKRSNKQSGDGEETKRTRPEERQGKRQGDQN